MAASAHDQTEGHHAVGHRQAVGVPEVDLVLARRVLVERVLDRDPHRLQRLDRAFAERPGDVRRGQVEIRAVVERRRQAVVALGEIEELHLRGDVEREATVARPIEVAAQHLTRVALERSAVEIADVAEDARLGSQRISPREQLETVGVQAGQHVALLNPRESVDRRSVERHPLLEGVLELGRADGEALQLSQHVGEPQPNKPDAALLDRAQDVVQLGLHVDESRSSGVR